MIKHLKPKTPEQLKVAEKQDKREIYFYNLSQSNIFTYFVFFIVFFVLWMIEKSAYQWIVIYVFCFVKMIIEFIPKKKLY